LPNALQSVTEYIPFKTTSHSTALAGDLDQLTRVARDLTYHTTSNDLYGDLRQLSTETVHLGNGVTLTTSYSHYTLGKPTEVTNPYGNLTKYTYDQTTGNLVSTENALHEVTWYTYTAPNGPTPGQVYQIHRSQGTSGPKTLLTTNSYYESGPNRGKLEASTNAITGLTTSYTYWDDGQSKETFRSWTDSSTGFHKVRDSYTDYNSAGRAWHV
jgi:hypothetical protein